MTATTRPGYWLFETSGVLRPAVEAYLNEEPMTMQQTAAMRAYLRQWIAGDWAPSSVLGRLREDINKLTTRRAIQHWLSLAQTEGIDPL